MGKKVIKLTEKDVQNIVVQTMNEMGMDYDMGIEAPEMDYEMEGEVQEGGMPEDMLQMGMDAGMSEEMLNFMHMYMMHIMGDSEEIDSDEDMEMEDDSDVDMDSDVGGDVGEDMGIEYA